MKHLIYIVLIVISFFAGLFLNTPTDNDFSVSSIYESCDLSEETLLEEINIHRKTPLKFSYIGKEFALVRLPRVEQKFSHDGFDEMAKGYFGNQYRHFGENLYKGKTCYSKEVVDAWMASDSHREILTRELFTSVGFGVSDTHVVAIFGG